MRFKKRLGFFSLISFLFDIPSLFSLRFGLNEGLYRRSKRLLSVVYLVIIFEGNFLLIVYFVKKRAMNEMTRNNVLYSNTRVASLITLITHAVTRRKSTLKKRESHARAGAEADADTVMDADA